MSSFPYCYVHLITLHYFHLSRLSLASICSSILQFCERGNFRSSNSTLRLHNHWRRDLRLSTGSNSVTRSKGSSPRKRRLPLQQPKHNQHSQFCGHSWRHLSHVPCPTVRLPRRSLQCSSTRLRRRIRLECRVLHACQPQLCKGSWLESDIG